MAEVLWRGLTGMKTTHWIVRLADGSHGLIAKTRGRWTFAAGSRDDVVASLPEQQMEAAVARLLGKSAPARAGAEILVDASPGFALRTLARSGGVLVAGGKKSGQRAAWRLEDGAALDDVPEPGSGDEQVTGSVHPPEHEGYLQRVANVKPASKAPQAVAPDGRIASWRWGDDERTVSVRGPDGSSLELQTPLGKITRVGFAGDAVLVAFAAGKRLATFDARGVQRHLVDGRELGETIDELVPLPIGRRLRVRALAPRTALPGRRRRARGGRPQAGEVLRRVRERARRRG